MIISYYFKINRSASVVNRNFKIRKSASMISRCASQLTVPETEHCFDKKSMFADIDDDDDDDYDSSLDRTDYQEPLLSVDYHSLSPY